MKLFILQEQIKKGLNVIERVSSKSLTLPVLNNILISCEKNFLNLAATDLEIGINWWSLVKSEKEGKITVPVKLFSSFVSLLPNKKLCLSSRDNDLIIEYEDYKSEIKGLSADEFPIIPKITDGESVFIDSFLFCQGLGQVCDIPVLSTTRPEISGVYLSFSKDMINIVSTDSFRLGEKKIFIKNNLNLSKDYSIIIPQRAAKEIINIFSELKGQVKIYFSSNQIMFESQMEETNHPQIQLVSRLIEGDYPNYKEIIPSKHATEIIADKSVFLNQIKTASLFSGKINEVKIKTDSAKNRIAILGQSSEIGKHESFIPVKLKGESAEVSFNYKFLIDGLANIKSSEVAFELNGDSGPGLLKPIGDASYIYVVMPIKNN